jgi:ectoine hydroxylase-related dioxygenase (phytanoyl-CoA dioxygenase family)
MLDSWCKENDVPVPFLQIFNVHRGSTPDAQLICELATSPQMGSMACELLGVPSVRLYQTSVFMKERGHGETSWHADLATAPFDSNHMVTCWIALTPIATEYDSPLEFASGSHRDLALPYWYTEEGMDNPRGDPREYDVDMHLPLVPGDSTWHVSPVIVHACVFRV